MGKDRMKLWKRKPEALTPLPTQSRGSRLHKWMLGAGRGLLRASLKVSPRPTALVIRRIFARSAFHQSMSQLRHAPTNVLARIDEHYGTLRDERMDIYVPEEVAHSKGRLPTIVWTHGGGFLGGDKSELSGYFRLIADAGFTVVGVDYTRAPEAKYPTPVRQVFAALRYLQSYSARLHVDPTRIILAGDSAGAQISAQIAALSSNPNYAQRMGIAPTLPIEHLRGIALCCGIYDLGALDQTAALKNFFTTVGWSYSGSRDFLEDHGFVTSHSVIRHINQNFPRAFVTAGNADPLLQQSTALVTELKRNGIETETLFFPPDYQPPLSHEYQFDLNLEEARLALRKLLGFFERCSANPAEEAGHKAA